MFQSLDFLDERKYRNFCIRQDYKKLRDGGMKVKEIYSELSKKWTTKKHTLRPDSIRTIMYRK